MTAVLLPFALTAASCGLAGETVPSASEPAEPVEAVIQKAAQGGNLHYQNLILKIGDTIFFNSSEGFLSKASGDGSSPEILLEETCGNLASDSSRLFYSEDSRSGSLAKVNLDGSSSVRIRQTSVKYLICTPEWLYAIEVGTGLPIRLMKDGTVRSLLSEQPAIALTLSGQKLYISGADNESGLIAVDLASGEQEKLRDYKISSLNAAGEYLYYSLPSDDYRLHAFSESQKTDWPISRFSIEKPFIISGGFLYFIHAEEQNRLYRLAVQGNQKLDLEKAELMVDDLIDSFVICGDYIYYQRPTSKRIYRVSTDDHQAIRVT